MFFQFNELMDEIVTSLDSEKSYHRIRASSIRTARPVALENCDRDTVFKLNLNTATAATSLLIMIVTTCFLAMQFVGSHGQSRVTDDGGNHGSLTTAAITGH
jgi:hypothetical protein